MRFLDSGIRPIGALRWRHGMDIKGGDYRIEGSTVSTLPVDALIMTGNAENAHQKGPQLSGELEHTGSRYWIFAIVMRHREAPTPVDLTFVHTVPPVGARP